MRSPSSARALKISLVLDAASPAFRHIRCCQSSGSVSRPAGVSDRYGRYKAIRSALSPLLLSFRNDAETRLTGSVNEHVKNETVPDWSD